jgi:hypothetical protein
VYNPSTQYQIYRAEQSLRYMTQAQQRAADQCAGELAADLAGFCQALVRAVTLAGPREAWRGRSVRRARALPALAAPSAAD